MLVIIIFIISKTWWYSVVLTFSPVLKNSKPFIYICARRGVAAEQILLSNSLFLLQRIVTVTMAVTKVKDGKVPFAYKLGDHV